MIPWSQHSHFKLRTHSSVRCGHQTEPSQQPLVPEHSWSPEAHGTGEHSCAHWGRASREKELLKPNHPFQFLGMDLTRQSHRRHCWQGIQTEFMVLAFTLSCKTFASWQLNGHGEDLPGTTNWINLLQHKKYKLWAFQTPLPPYWAQQVWTPGSRWTNGIVRKAHHIPTMSFQSHHVRFETNVKEWILSHLKYWWEHSNNNRKQVNNHISVIGRNFSSKLSLRKMLRG